MYSFSIDYTVESDELSDEIKSLKERINELETMLRTIVQPFQEMRQSTNNYLRLIGLMLEHGGLTPDTILSEIKDPIEKSIVRVLTKKNDLNISQITDHVRAERGTASRRIIRDKIKNLEDKRKSFIGGIDKKTFAKYEQLLKTRQGLAIVPVNNNNCGYCYMRVTHQKINEIKMYKDLVFCENCVRILYIPEDIK